MVVALVAVVGALLLLAYNANPAQAAGDCSTTSGTTTCTYVSTGAEDTFVVPAGVSSVHVFATGAPGAVGSASGVSWACRSRCSGERQPDGLEPGDTLYVKVGGAPTGRRDCFAGVNCIGGFNGGGSSGSLGGGGGGASDVRTVSRDQERKPGLPADRGRRRRWLRSSNFCDETVEDRTGGAGGDAGSDGGDGETCVATPGGAQAGKRAPRAPAASGASGGTASIQGRSGSLGLGGSGGRIEQRRRRRRRLLRWWRRRGSENARRCCGDASGGWRRRLQPGPTTAAARPHHHQRQPVDHHQLPGPVV